MSGCRSHADQVGPYVLGALEPDEMDEMRAHLADCPRCSAEARSLAELPALMDLVKADAEVPVLSPGIEDEVLDRFVRERARSAPPDGGDDAADTHGRCVPDACSRTWACASRSRARTPARCG